MVSVMGIAIARVIVWFVSLCVCVVDGLVLFGPSRNIEG